MSAYDYLEPLAAEKAKEQGLPHIEAYLLSIAISQKRLADTASSGTTSIVMSLASLQGLLGSVVSTQYDTNQGSAIRTKSG